MQIEGVVGLPRYGEGVPARVTLGENGELLETPLHARYYALTKRGLMFHTATGSVTVAAAHVSPLAAGTGKPILGLFNPQGSKVNLVIVKLGVITISGTPGGPLLWNYGLNQSITATPNATPRPGLLSNTAPANAQGFSDTALTGSTALTLLRHAADISAVAAGAVNGPALEDLGGDIIIPPGGFLGLAAFAAGTTHIVQASISHLELPA